MRSGAQAMERRHRAAASELRHLQGCRPAFAPRQLLTFRSLLFNRARPLVEQSRMNHPRSPDGLAPRFFANK